MTNMDRCATCGFVRPHSIHRDPEHPRGHAFKEPSASAPPAPTPGYGRPDDACADLEGMRAPAPAAPPTTPDAPCPSPGCERPAGHSGNHEGWLATALPAQMAAAPPTTEAPRELLAEIERRVTRFAHAAIDYVQERSGGLSAETALMAHMDQRRGEIMSAVRLALREAREDAEAVLRGQRDLMAQTVRIRRAALGNEGGSPGIDTEEIVRDLRAKADRLQAAARVVVSEYRTDLRAGKWSDALLTAMDELRALSGPGAAPNNEATKEET